MDIRVLGFKTKLNKAGKSIDWVEYAGAHAIGTSSTEARVKDLIPPEAFDEDRDLKGTKMFHMNAVWDQIRPKYEAWKKGADMPETGTALANWPAIGDSEVFELNRAGLKSVEDVAGMSEGALSKVALPNPRELRKQARAFLKALETQGSASRIAELEAQVAELTAAAKPKKEKAA